MARAEDGAAGGEADEDGEGEPESDGPAMGFLLPLAAAAAAAAASSSSTGIGSSSRLLKRPPPPPPPLTTDTASLSGCRSSIIPGPSTSRPPYPKRPKPPPRKKNSNAGRVEITVEVVNGKRRYLCPQEPSCGSHFSRKNDAYRHLDDRHGAAKQEHVCGCGRKLSRRDALHRHYATCQWTKTNWKKGKGGGEEEEEEEAEGGDDEEEEGGTDEDEEDQLAEDE